MEQQPCSRLANMKFIRPIAGLEALDAVAKVKLDVTLLDIGLPELDGYETARRIRALHQVKN